MMDIVALPTGEVVAVGSECAVDQKRRAAAVERWRLGSANGQVELLQVPAGSWYQSIEATDSNDIDAVFIAEQAHLAHFDGRRWSVVRSSPARDLLIEKDAPDHRRVVATLPTPSDPRAALTRVDERFIAPSGDA